MITTVAGDGNRAGFVGDGSAATGALLNIPSDVAVDGSDSLWIADSGNNRIRKVDGTSGIISTIAGGANDGFSGDAGPAANSLLSFPWKMTIDAVGSVYVADRVNNRIRKISAGIAPPKALTNLSAASYNVNGSLAPNVIVSVYGQGLRLRAAVGEDVCATKPTRSPRLATRGGLSGGYVSPARR